LEGRTPTNSGNYIPEPEIEGSYSPLLLAASSKELDPNPLGFLVSIPKIDLDPSQI